MNRRGFLASALTGACSVFAGCNVAESRTEHTDPTLQVNEGPSSEGPTGDTEMYLRFDDGGTKLATVGVDPHITSQPSALRISISHRPDTRLQLLTQRVTALNTVPDGAESPVELSPSSENPPRVPVSLSRDGTAAIVEVDQFGDLADETVSIPLTVTRWPESGDSLAVESTVELVKTDSPDHTHVLTGSLEFNFTTLGTGSGDGPSDTPT